MEVKIGMDIYHISFLFTSAQESTRESPFISIYGHDARVPTVLDVTAPTECSVVDLSEHGVPQLTYLTEKHEN